MAIKSIEVVIDPQRVPDHLAPHLELWFGNLLRKAGVPLYERAIAEGPHRGSLTRETLEGGSLLFRWTDELRIHT